MNLIMPFDTETTGIPDWGQPSEAEHQPHIVSLAALLVDDESYAVVEELDVIIRPNGWVIPDETVAIHGISMERAMDEGIPEEEAVSRLIEMFGRATLRIAHNKTFDERMVRIALKRHIDPVSGAAEGFMPSDVWKSGAGFCTCSGARKHGGFKKSPTLHEAYLHYTGKPLEGAHCAMNDARACLEVYRGIHAKVAA
jgi:DNA polymerase-3 subunit epsilon